MPKSTPTIPSMSTREFTWGIRYLLFQLLFLPGLLGALLHTLWPDFPSLGINFIYYLINFLTIVCILHNYMEKDGAFAIKHWRQLLLTVGIGFAVYWVSNVAAPGSTRGEKNVLAKYKPRCYACGRLATTSQRGTRRFLTDEK